MMSKRIALSRPSLRAKRSNPFEGRHPVNGLLRRFAPRNDGFHMAWLKKRGSLEGRASLFTSDRRLGHGLRQIGGLAEPFLLDRRHGPIGLGLDDRGVDRVDQSLVLEPADPGEIGRLA